MIPVLDDGFIHRVYRTSSWLTALAALGGLAVGRTGVCWGILLGSALTLLTLVVLERGIKRFIRPGVRDCRPLLLYVGGTYPALLLYLWVVTRSPYVNLPAFAAGVALPDLVMILKAVGQLLIQKSRLEQDAEPIARTKSG